MNKQQTALKVRDTFRKYREQGTENPCRRNHVILYANNTSSHEAKKCELCHDILRGAIPYSQLKNGKISYRFEKPHSFITGAVDRNTGKRRDIVILETGQVIEIVNTHISDELLEEYKKDDVLIIKV